MVRHVLNKHILDANYHWSSPLIPSGGRYARGKLALVLQNSNERSTKENVRGEDQWYCTKDMLMRTVHSKMTLSLKDQGFVPIC